MTDEELDALDEMARDLCHTGELSMPYRCEISDMIMAIRAEVERLREYYRASEDIAQVADEWKRRKAQGLLVGPNIFNLTDKMTAAEARLFSARAALSKDPDNG